MNYVTTSNARRLFFFLEGDLYLPHENWDSQVSLSYYLERSRAVFTLGLGLPPQTNANAIGTPPQKKVGLQMSLTLPAEDVARAQQPQQEVGAKEGFPVSNSPTIAQPSIAPARGPWLFPDSSSRYLSATDLSSLSSADLWRARNEIFARKGYKFSSPRGIAFAQTLGNDYRAVDDNRGRVFNNMNQYERANVTLIRSIERGR